jgi:hypothetical protein
VPELKSVRDEKFAQYVASGISQSEAYRRVSGKTANANNHGDDYRAKRGMKERIAEIRAENAARCDMSKEEYRSYLISAMQTPAADIDPHHQFCQVYKGNRCTGGNSRMENARQTPRRPASGATLRLGRVDQDFA